MIPRVGGRFLLKGYSYEVVRARLSLLVLSLTLTRRPGRVVYTFDDERQTKEVARYDEHGVLKQRLVYSTDARGNEAGVVELNYDGTPKPVELRRYEKGALLGTLSGVPAVEFVYDARGNWTRKTHVVRPAGAQRPEPYWAEHRVIVYY